jgi:hypothetical protein
MTETINTTIYGSLPDCKLTDDSNGPPDQRESILRTTFSAPGSPNGMAELFQQTNQNFDPATYLPVGHFLLDMLAE